jgi:hypothetical protein
MFFPRALIIAAEPQLRATLVEQFMAGCGDHCDVRRFADARAGCDACG